MSEQPKLQAERWYHRANRAGDTCWLERPSDDAPATAWLLPDTAPLPPAVVARALAEAPGHERSCEDCLGTGEEDVGEDTKPCEACGGSGRVRVIVVRATPRPAPAGEVG